MLHQLFRRGNMSALFSFSDRQDLLPFPFIAFPFLIGIISGTVVGLFSDAVPAALNSFSFLSESAASGKLSEAFWRAFRYILFAAVFSTGYLGIFLLPLLAAFRGFSFSCSVSALFAADGFSGMLFAALIVGLPALIGFPAFLSACGWAMKSSFLIFSDLLHPSLRVPFERRNLRRFVWFLFLCTAETAYYYFICPLMIQVSALS